MQTLTTKRLLLREFTEHDREAIFAIYGDKEANRFLPWFPLETLEEADTFYKEKLEPGVREGRELLYAVCFKEDNVPVGYVHVSLDDSHDFGYGFRKDYWGQGLAAEAGQVVIEKLKAEGITYITATHDVNNPRSGAVMKKLGMHYVYSYKEQWKPKDIPVIFRMYQLNLDGKYERVYWKYWLQSAVHFVEKGING